MNIIGVDVHADKEIPAELVELGADDVRGGPYMKIRIPLTAHFNGVLDDAGNGLVMGCIGDYVRIDSSGEILDGGVRLCVQVFPVEALAEHASLLQELSEAIAKLRQIVHVTNMNVD